MNFGFDKKLLDFLEKSHNEGEPVSIFHIFLKDREIGRLAASEHSSILAGDITPIIHNKLSMYLERARETPSYKRVTEFLLDQDELAYRIIVEVLEPPTALYIFGAGHVGQAVAMVGAMVGYKVVVIDDRKEFLTAERFPDISIDLLEENYERLDHRVKIPKNSAVVIVTRGHQYDEICLKQILNLNTRYVGMIGSRRRVTTIFRRLIKEGFDKRLLEKVHAPIGLKIGAVSPQEIAVAIMAEIISVASRSNPSPE
jgi:xanthine/CO dehydrogenase XdhC/CoxF family maturation factor